MTTADPAAAPPPRAAVMGVTGSVWVARHAAHDADAAILLGRTVDAGLSSVGRREAEALAERCLAAGIVRVHTSPRRRTLETARIVADRIGCPVEVAPALDEVDFGAWSGARIDDLVGDPGWHDWNAKRRVARCPGGECMRDVRRRALAQTLLASRAARAEGPVLLVTHAELVRALLIEASGMSLDDWAQMDVPPAMLVAVEVEHGRLILARDDAGHGPVPGEAPA